MDAPKVIYIGGHGRSGTTILDRVLAEVTGGFSAGEIHRFWEYGLARDWTCSCGERLRDCEIWGPVLRQSFSEAGRSEKEILEAWRTVARPHSLLSLWYPSLRSARFQRQLSRYRSFLEVLYRTLSQRSGKQVIVDSSGSPFHGYILSGMDGIEGSMIHLVRDARAVAFSNQKRKPNPSDPRPGATMETKPALQVSMTWVVYNYLLENLRNEFNKQKLVKYENIFDRSGQKMRTIYADFEGDIENEEIFLEKGIVDISLGHTGQGNPSRFNEGKIKLKVDREWKKRILTSSNCVVNILCYFSLSKYGYI